MLNDLREKMKEYIRENEHQGTHLDLLENYKYPLIVWSGVKVVLDDFVRFVENYIEGD
jgi:hypothetical protein